MRVARDATCAKEDISFPKAATLSLVPVLSCCTMSSCRSFKSWTRWDTAFENRWRRDEHGGRKNLLVDLLAERVLEENARILLNGGISLVAHLSMYKWRGRRMDMRIDEKKR